MKIAIFHCGFIYTGGGERIVIEEIEGLRERGHTVDCFVPIYDPKLSYPDIIRSIKIKTFLPQLSRFVPFRFAIQMVGSCLLAPFLAWRFTKFDVILGANQPGAYMAWVIAKLIKKPYFVYLSQPNRVLYPRDYEDWQNVKDYYFLNRIINQFFTRLVVELDRRSITSGRNLFVNGSFIAKDIVRIYEPSRWIDCPGGACISNDDCLKIDRYKGRVRINGFRIDKPYVLYTSRHEPWKRFDWALEIFAEVVKEIPKVKLVIPGKETTLTPRLKDIAASLAVSDKVVFTGEISQKNLWKLYRNAAVYIFTSPKEDLGIVVQEAQAAGLPVVAWKNGGPTVTVKDKVTGFLCSPYKQAEMVKRILYLLENPKVRNEMGKAAWQHIKENFTWARHIDILEKEFKKAL